MESYQSVLRPGLSNTYVSALRLTKCDFLLNQNALIKVDIIISNDSNVVNVPADVNSVVNTLPRPINE